MLTYLTFIDHDPTLKDKTPRTNTYPLIVANDKAILMLLDLIKHHPDLTSALQPIIDVLDRKA